MEENKITVEIIDKTTPTFWEKVKSKLTKIGDDVLDFVADHDEAVMVGIMGAAVAFDAFAFGAAIGSDKAAKAESENKRIQYRDIYAQTGADGQPKMVLLEQTTDGSLYKTCLDNNQLRDVRRALSTIDEESSE